MLLYILKLNSCLALCFLFYKLCFAKINAHKLKRFFLLFIVLFSIVIPFVTFTEYIETVEHIVVNHSINAKGSTSSIYNNQAPIHTRPKLDFSILWTIYYIGVLLFAFRFIKNLIKITQIIKTNIRHKQQQFVYILLETGIVPHSFFNYIFLNKSQFQDQKIPKAILLHEQAHAKQKHSFDILFIELFHIVMWFNPLIYFLKKDIKLNHEYLADATVINQGIETNTYQKLLLSLSMPLLDNTITHAINYAPIKNRLLMLKTTTKKATLQLRSVLFIPFLGILIFSFSTKETLSSPPKATNNKALDTYNQGVTEAMMAKYRKFINDFEQTNRIFLDKHIEAIEIYNMMTLEQQKTVKKHRKYRNPIHHKIEQTTQKQLTALKTSNTPLIIDGIRLDKASQQTFDFNTIVYHRKGRRYITVDDNPTSKIDCILAYTKEGYENIVLKKNYNVYYNLLLKYASYYNGVSNEDRDYVSEISLLKNQIKTIYNNFTAKEIELFHPLTLEAFMKRKTLNKKRGSKTAQEYNIIVKKINDIHYKAKKIYKYEDILLMEKLYNKMTEDEKKAAEPYPNLPYSLLKKIKNKHFK